MLWWDGDGLCLLAKRLEHGRFIWPNATEGSVHLSGAQLSMLLEGIDWRLRIPMKLDSDSTASWTLQPDIWLTYSRNWGI